MLDTAAPLLRQDLMVGNKGLGQGLKVVVDISPTNIVGLASPSYFEYAPSMNKLPKGDPGVGGRFV